MDGGLSWDSHCHHTRHPQRKAVPASNSGKGEMEASPRFGDSTRESENTSASVDINHPHQVTEQLDLNSSATLASVTGDLTLVPHGHHWRLTDGRKFTKNSGGKIRCDYRINIRWVITEDTSSRHSGPGIGSLGTWLSASRAPRGRMSVLLVPSGSPGLLAHNPLGLQQRLQGGAGPHLPRLPHRCPSQGRKEPAACRGGACPDAPCMLRGHSRSGALQ